MPRKPSLEIRLRCNKCKEYTKTTNPVIIKKSWKSISHQSCMFNL